MMLLIDNRRWLGQNFRDVAEVVKQTVDASPTGEVVVEEARSGDNTLKVQGKYVHSKYNPRQESERILANSKKNQPTLFFGVGLGYHIEAFIANNPGTRIALYEPNAEVLVAFLERVNLTKLTKEKILDIIVGTDSDIVANRIKAVHQKTTYQLQLVTLPTTTVLYADMYERVLQILKESKKSHRDSMATDVAFQKRWVTNAIKNAPTVLTTPNMLVDIDKKHFKNKPAIIVAAGPSLNREFETLRKIKAEGRAYIFAVGSAINALINHDIYPDAFCTYDPTVKNQMVNQIIKDKNITEIPMIFGSSVGFEVLEKYPGAIYHAITSQDTIIKELVETDLPFVHDAPSIAVVTYNLLFDLGCSPILLAGQNLAYLDNKNFAEGINYVDNPDVSLGGTILTKGTTEDNVVTTVSFNSMRNQLELYIKLGRPTINTTVGGAHIEGTTFEYLENLLETELAQQNIIEDWSTTENTYDKEVVKEQLNKLVEEHKSQQIITKDGFAQLQKIYDLVVAKNYYQIENEYGKFDKILSRMQKNRFYLAFVEPMIRVQYEALRQVIEDLRYITNQQDKGNKVIPLFNEYFCVVRDYTAYAKELFDEMKEEIEKEER